MTGNDLFYCKIFVVKSLYSDVPLSWTMTYDDVIKVVGIADDEDDDDGDHEVVFGSREAVGPDFRHLLSFVIVIVFCLRLRKWSHLLL